MTARYLTLLRALGSVLSSSPVLVDRGRHTRPPEDQKRHLANIRRRKLIKRQKAQARRRRKSSR